MHAITIPPNEETSLLSEAREPNHGVRVFKFGLLGVFALVLVVALSSIYANPVQPTNNSILANSAIPPVAEISSPVVAAAAEAANSAKHKKQKQAQAEGEENAKKAQAEGEANAKKAQAEGQAKAQKAQAEGEKKAKEAQAEQEKHDKVAEPQNDSAKGPAADYDKYMKDFGADYKHYLTGYSKFLSSTPAGNVNSKDDFVSGFSQYMQGFEKYMQNKAEKVGQDTSKAVGDYNKFLEGMKYETKDGKDKDASSFDFQKYMQGFDKYIQQNANGKSKEQAETPTKPADTQTAVVTPAVDMAQGVMGDFTKEDFGFGVKSYLNGYQKYLGSMKTDSTKHSKEDLASGFSQYMNGFMKWQKSTATTGEKMGSKYDGGFGLANSLDKYNDFLTSVPIDFLGSAKSHKHEAEDKDQDKSTKAQEVETESKGQASQDAGAFEKWMKGSYEKFFQAGAGGGVSSFLGGAGGGVSVQMGMPDLSKAPMGPANIQTGMPDLSKAPMGPANIQTGMPDMSKMPTMPDVSSPTANLPAIISAGETSPSIPANVPYGKPPKKTPNY